MHGQDVFVDYYHMRTDSCKLKSGTYIKRGEFIGKEGAPHNMHLKLVVYRSDPSFVSVMGQANRDDPNNYGHRMGYMQYWDGEEKLDISYEEVTKRSKTQRILIRDFVEMYDGPLSEEVHRGLTTRIGGRIHMFSPIDHFKFAKYLYDKDPSTFKGNKMRMDTLIAEIYKNQPVVLTLPFK